MQHPGLKFAPQLTRHFFINVSNISIRRRLYLCLVRSQICYGSQIWSPQSVTLVKRMERLQRRATKYILNLPFRCETTYIQRLDLVGLLPLCYWYEYLDMITFYKLTHGIMTIDTELLPSPTSDNRRETRSSDPSHSSFTTTQCKTTTYQRSFLNRTKRLWNTLPKHVTNNNNTFGEYKNSLFKYYKSAVKNIFDVDDPRTWKSICLLCNKSRNLSCQISCCF